MFVCNPTLSKNGVYFVTFCNKESAVGVPGHGGGYPLHGRSAKSHAHLIRFWAGLAACNGPISFSCSRLVPDGKLATNRQKLNEKTATWLRPKQTQIPITMWRTGCWTKNFGNKIVHLVTPDILLKPFTIVEISGSQVKWLSIWVPIILMTSREKCF